MSNCSNSGVNSQFKAIQARLDRIDDDLVAHYAGMSQLVASLAANPLTASAAATSLPVYNFSSMGQNLIKRLLNLIPGVEKFKQLQHIDAAARVSGMAESFAAATANIAVQTAEQVSWASQQKIDCELAYAEAVARGATEEVLAPLRSAMNDAAQVLFKSNTAVSQIEQFIQTLDDISNCRSRSMILRP